MKIWVYRPDKALPSLDPSLLYYKGQTAESIKSEPKPRPTPRLSKYPDHYIEVPHDR